MSMSIKGLYRFPVKGLSGENLDSVPLEAGFGFPFDRVYAVTDGSLDFDPAHPVFAPKTQFLMLAKYEGLVRLHTRFLLETATLVVAQDGEPTFDFALETDSGRAAFASFLGSFVAAPLPGKPQLVSAPGHQFTDVSVHSIALMRSISLINLATVRDLSQRLGTELDPIRFRGNLLFDGAEPWSELDWTGRELYIGETVLKVIRRTKRCAATSVNPMTGKRDVNVPIGIRENFGHGDLGIYAEVIHGGTLHSGASIQLSAPVPESTVTP